jgi:hypothetical protein
VRRFMSAVLAGGFLVLAFGASTAASDRVIHATFDFSFSTDADFGCGFPVHIDADVVGNQTAILNSDGLVVREVDTYPASRFTYSANGHSVSFEGNLVATTTYPGGAVLGGPAIVDFTGLISKTPTLGAHAGLTEFTATVVDFTPEGIPVWDLDSLVVEHGNAPDDLAALCAFLAP